MIRLKVCFVLLVCSGFLNTAGYASILKIRKDVDTYDRIEISSQKNVFLKNNTELDGVVVETDVNNISGMSITVKNNTLYIDIGNRMNDNSVFELNLQGIKELKCKGRGTVNVLGLNTEDITVVSDGLGGIKIKDSSLGDSIIKQPYGSISLNNVKSKNTVVYNTSSRKLEANNFIADNMKIESSSSGGFIGDNIVVNDNFEAYLSGSGNMTLNSIQTLNLKAKITSSGDFKANIASEVKNDNISLYTNGSGNITIDNISSESLVAEVLSAGNIRLTGVTEALSIEIDGSGKFYGSTLGSKSCTLKSYGSGNAYVSVKDNINIHLNSSGNIEITGNPRFDSLVTDGSGSVRMK